MLAWIWTWTAAAAPPADLDGLVEVALAGDPGALALALDADAARARASGAGRLVDPQLMLGVDAIGAPMDAADPTMGMVGITQMLRGFGEGRALSSRAALDAERALVERDVVEADLRLRLWQAAARVRALDEELRLLDEQIRGAGAARTIAFARYGAGAVVSESMGAMQGAGMAMDGMDGMPMDTAPPAVVPRGGGGGGMAGMAMGGGTGASRGPVVPTASPTLASVAPGAPMTSGASGGIPVLLRLDAEIARVDAERAALVADLDGELAVLAAFVGDEAAAAVRAEPDRYLGAAVALAPEVALADLDRRIAQADLTVARRARNPDVMVSVAERLMPDGMPAGTDVALGIELPLWGSRGRLVDASVAQVAASEARLARVDRDLRVAADRAEAALAAARARADALELAAVPRARQAWEASLALFGAATTTSDDVVRTWTTWITIEREAVAARRDVQLRAAELARVEGR